MAPEGETPAAWTRPVTSPSAVACSTSESTDSRNDTSTAAVLVSNPAAASTSAAASAFSWRRSASRTCLPALTRRAMGLADRASPDHDDDVTHGGPSSASRIDVLRLVRTSPTG